MRFTYDNNYFNDRYQGIPIGGYTEIVNKMLAGADLLLDTDYFEFIKENPDVAEKTVYTGEVDKFYSYEYGALEWRAVRFENKVYDCENYQGNAVVNYTEAEIPYTRAIEHKHFDGAVSEKTVVSYEYSSEWRVGEDPYYPINNDKNNELYAKYEARAKSEKNVIFGGRLGTYKYYDMDKVIRAALDTVRAELG